MVRPTCAGRRLEFVTAIATAIARSGVRRVINLSSVGAELPAGTGPIAGQHEQEQRLNALAGVDLLHLRPGYFMENHLHAAAAIAALGVYPSLERSDVSVPMVATPDIAAVVVRELTETKTRGVLHLHAPRHYTFQQAATVLGNAIGRPGCCTSGPSRYRRELRCSRRAFRGMPPSRWRRWRVGCRPGRTRRCRDPSR